MFETERYSKAVTASEQDSSRRFHGDEGRKIHLKKKRPAHKQHHGHTRAPAATAKMGERHSKRCLAEAAYDPRVETTAHGGIFDF